MSVIESAEPLGNPVLATLELTHPELYASLVDSADRFWDERPDHMKRRERDLDKVVFIAREVSFVEKIHAAVADLAASHEGPITLLLDCDETFVKNEYGRKDEIIMHVRPAIDTLLLSLDAIAGDRVDVGLLTSRAQDHLDEEVVTHEFGYMRRLGSKLNPAFIISSRNGSPIYDHEPLQTVPLKVDFGEHELAVRAIRSIMRPELLEPALANDWAALGKLVYRGHWYDGKLAILAHLAETHPDRGFVFVDDLPFAASIDPNHPRVRGVALGDAAFYLR